MSDVLADIFSEEVIGRLRKCAANSPRAEFRYGVLSLTAGSDGLKNWPDSNPWQREHYLQTRERWSQWIATAIAAGLFREPHGAELKSRLTGIDDDGFRSALGECMCCWALACELGLRVQPRPLGRGERVLEFAVRTGQEEVNFEVKSPRLQRAGRRGLEEEDSAGALENYSAALAMTAALRSANRQFAHSLRNVLVLALPEVGDKSGGMLSEKWPWPIIRALYGEAQLTAPPSGGAGTSAPATGNFLKLLNGMPRFTRISAVVELEDSFRDPQLQAVVLHNPYSERPLDWSTLAGWRQFAMINGEIHCVREAFSNRPPPDEAD